MSSKTRSTSPMAATGNKAVSISFEVGELWANALSPSFPIPQQTSHLYRSHRFPFVGLLQLTTSRMPPKSPPPVRPEPSRRRSTPPRESSAPPPSTAEQNHNRDQDKNPSIFSFRTQQQSEDEMSVARSSASRRSLRSHNASPYARPARRTTTANVSSV